MSEEDTEKLHTEPDDRIPCTNHSSLNKIMEIATKHFNDVANSLESEESRTQLKTRFSERFREIVHQNVSVRGLPWATSGDLISQDLQEQQVGETEDALHSLLAKKVEELAKKRKNSTSEVLRLCEMRLKHQRQNLKKTDIEFEGPPRPTLKSSALTASQHQALTEVLSDCSHLKAKIKCMDQDFTKLQEDFKSAKSIVSMDDTGYASS
ncbi:hypothetical protein JTE90_016595 [Oedothorax gibbosus]|uniref:Uncharacterized protein n=1 Tax=Oedothorax gibbosus TaxID=931172 RepID=A0AAV6UAB4_9ARAC|nr:hypothetical protein JTE90_016595 [Oedothorax gibbosus]